MAQRTLHRAFLIPEILENILLHTDTCTLLTSAQRVCHYWHNLITESSNLQAALFFKPAKHKSQEDSKRIRNPLIEENLWPHFFRKQLRTGQRAYVYQKLNLPFVDLHKEAAYLRAEASWRRMLPQQPPTNRIGIIERYPVESSESGTYTHGIESEEGWFLRMGNFDTAVSQGMLVAGQDKLVFWHEADVLGSLEQNLQEKRAVVVSRDLVDCDVVIFVRFHSLSDRILNKVLSSYP